MTDSRAYIRVNEVSAARRGACGGVQIEYSMLKTHLSLVVVAAPALLANGFRVRARVRPSDVRMRTVYRVQRFSRPSSKLNLKLLHLSQQIQTLTNKHRAAGDIGTKQDDILPL